MGLLMQDTRYAIRTLRHTPGFTTVAILTLALGIGANTAIFSVVDAVLLRPLKLSQSDRLVELLRAHPEGGEPSHQLSFPNFRDIRTRNRSFAQMGAFRFWLFNLADAREPETVLGIYASEELLPLLGVHPVLGRGFLAGSDQPGRAPEALLSHVLWQRQFSSDRGVLGRVVILDGRAATIVGVLPADFHFPDLTPADAPLPTREPDLIMPIGLEQMDHEDRGNDNYWVVGRLAPGVSTPQAQRDIGAIAGQLAQEFPDHDGGLEVALAGLKQQVIGDAGGPLLMLLGSVGFVLLIACTNVTGLLVARAAGRQREFALRTALGASPSRLARQLLTESLILALAGGILGLLFASWGLDLIRRNAPNTLPRLVEVTLDGRMLGFTLLLSLVTGVLFGVTPALQGLRGSAAATLKDGARGTSGGGQRRLRGGLVVAEIGLSLILLLGAGLLLRSFIRLSAVDPGFDGRNVVTMLAILPPARYPDPASQRAFVSQSIARIRELPGVEAAGVVNTLPLSNLGSNTSITVVGHPAPPSGTQPSIPYRTVEGDYFDALQIRLATGRGFSPSDSAGAPLVALLNEAAVRHYFPGEDPLGRAVQLGNDMSSRTVIGVLRDHHEDGLDRPPIPEVYYPFAQGPDPIFTLVARTVGDPTGLIPSIKRELRAIDPSQSVFLVRTMRELLASSLERRRFNLQLLGAFAGAALLLAAIGLYGLVAYSVSQRTREIGVRIALGAPRGTVLSMLLREGLTLTGLGIAAGLMASVLLARVLQSQLFGIGPMDPVAILSVALLLSVVAVVAILIPARRATKVDPMTALRSE